MRVLLMEDERRMAALLKRGLTEEGPQVSFGHDGMEGLEIARAGEFDVLVLDVMLPGLTASLSPAASAKKTIKRPSLC